jgi:hypothetical protein
MDRVAGATIAALLHAEQGRLVVTADYSLAVAQDHAGNELCRWKANGDHFANFIDAVRARDVGEAGADYRNYVRSERCENGRFAFRGLPDGGWFLIVPVRAEGDEGPLVLMRHVVTRGGRVVGVTL